MSEIQGVSLSRSNVVESDSTAFLDGPLAGSYTATAMKAPTSLTRTAAVLGWVLALSMAAPAASGPLEPPDLSRYLRWGPFRVRPGFVVTNLGYEDNVFYRTDSGEAPVVGDYTVTFSPRLDGLVLFGDRAFVTFTERVEYTAYRDNSSLNFLNQFGDARLTLPFGRTGLYVDGTYNRTKDRQVDFQDVRNERTEAGWGAGAILEAGWRTDVEIGVFRTDWSNRDPDSNPALGFSIADRLDRVERGERFKARYLALGRTRLTLDASRTTIRFDNPAVGRDAEDTRVLPGIDFGRGGPLTGTLRLGRARLDARDPARRDFSGVVGDAKITYRRGGDTTIQVGGRRDVRFSVYEGNQWYLDSGYDARAVRYLTRWFGVEAGGGKRRLTFSETAARVDRILTYDVGVRLRLSESTLGRRVEYSLKFGRLRRDSTLDQIDYSRNTFGFGATVGY